MPFFEGQRDITIELIKLADERTLKNIHATADSQNFLWTKPIPISDSRISYINWLKQKRGYAKLERVDEFEREMKALRR